MEGRGPCHWQPSWTEIPGWAMGFNDSHLPLRKAGDMFITAGLV